MPNICANASFKSLLTLLNHPSIFLLDLTYLTITPATAYHLVFIPLEHAQQPFVQLILDRRDSYECYRHIKFKMLSEGSMLNTIQTFGFPSNSPVFCKIYRVILVSVLLQVSLKGCNHHYGLQR